MLTALCSMSRCTSWQALQGPPWVDQQSCTAALMTVLTLTEEKEATERKRTITINKTAVCHDLPMPLWFFTLFLSNWAKCFRGKLVHLEYFGSISVHFVLPDVKHTELVEIATVNG